MEKLITVKGIGQITMKPDLVVLSLELETTSCDYDQCMKIAGERGDLLKDAIVKAGLPGDSLKTSNFGVTTEYRSEKNRDGNYRSVFVGWKCSHDFKVEFPLDIKLLKTVLHFIAESHADCKVGVDFTLADSGDAETALLDSAAKNARKKAETLCNAIGVTLGSLVRIDYNWSEINIFSHTKYDSGIFSSAPTGVYSEPEIDPEDIKLNDNATFVWEIA